jgi:anti-sigma factor RsiW
MRWTLSAYVDGELDEQASASVAAHLRDCWDCSANAELAHLLKRSLQNLRERHGDTLGVARLRRFADGLTTR